jgi:disulfide bond formation protein DsbB
MQMMVSYFLQPRLFSISITAFCTAALLMALTSQYAFDMEPCILCLYQRAPYVIAAILGLVGYRMALRDHYRACAFMVFLAGIALIANSMLAFYHVGVEQHWWKSAFEACTFDPTKIREAAYKPAVPCDQIPWSFMGISMAGYNVLACGFIGAVCIWFALSLKNRQPN